MSLCEWCRMLGLIVVVARYAVYHPDPLGPGVLAISYGRAAHRGDTLCVCVKGVIFEVGERDRYPT